MLTASDSTTLQAHPPSPLLSRQLAQNMELNTWAVKAASYMLDGFPEAANGLANHFSQEAQNEPAAKTVAIAIAFGADPVDIYRRALRLCRKVDLDGKQLADLLKYLMVEIGGSAATLEPAPKTKIDTCVGLLSLLGNPEALSIALELAGSKAEMAASAPAAEGGLTPLMLACARGHVECSRILAGFGAALDCHANFDPSRDLLSFACASGSGQMCFELLGLGAPLAIGDGKPTALAFCKNDDSRKACSSAIAAWLESKQIAAVSTRAPKAAVRTL